MHDLKSALLAAGLTTPEQYEAARKSEQKQQTNKEAKDRRKMVKAADTFSEFNSMRSFMDHIKKELRRDPTLGNLRRLKSQAHQLADQLNLHKKRRNKMHAFLAKVGEGLASRPDRQEKLEFLDEVFLILDPKLVNE